VPNVLVADDNPVSLRFFSDALAQLGLACELAHDGLETVARAERMHFDVLLIDARMPGLDGPAALARIRAGRGPSREAIALATTADASKSTRVELLGVGFVDVVAKPVTVNALRAALAPYVPGLAASAAPAGGGADDLLDDVSALSAVGGDVSILVALRGLFIAELDALPDELAAIAARSDLDALRDRLHRLDASAGFCGAPALVRSCAKLRAAFDDASTWPDAAIDEFLASSARVRARLVDAGAVPTR
jgi:CheY-like chemotaxis protein/HPt (histidine-containing phosphotransfer) domain-containing protein